MSQSKKKAEAPPSEKKYPTEKLLKSQALSGYQPDFAKVILKEKEYTLQGARAALDNVLKGVKK